MVYSASNKLIQFCKKTFKEPDVIMDLYDQTFAWASNKVVEILGFTHKELSNMRVFDLRIMKETTEEELAKRMQKEEFIDDMLFKTKKGTQVMATVKVKYVEFNKNPYHLVKIIKYTSKKN